MEYDRPLDTEPSEHVGHLAGQVCIRDAQRLVAGAGGIAKRAEHGEHRSHAELFPRKTRESKRGVKDGREEKSDAGLVDAARDRVGAAVDLPAELLPDRGVAAP